MAKLRAPSPSPISTCRFNSSIYYSFFYLLEINIKYYINCVIVKQGEGKEGLRRVLNADQAALLQQEICLLEDVLAFLQKVRTRTARAFGPPTHMTHTHAHNRLEQDKRTWSC